MNQLSARSRKNLEGVEPILVAVVMESIKESPYDFGIPSTGGKRTDVVQNALFKAGKSKADGYIKKSYHQTGKAFDIFGFVDGKATWDRAVLTAIAAHIKKVAWEKFRIKITWGGDWKKFVDMPHFQI